MSEMENQASALKQLLNRMVEAKQLSSADAETLARQCRQGSETPLKSEESVLRWLAKEYDLAYTALEEIEPDRQPPEDTLDRKSTRLNSSNGYISYAAFCLKKHSL